jgi:deoxyribodipyrimidine photo-lyase
MSHIVWFRKDLRIYDNPALLAASVEPIIPIYINDPAEQMGGMSKLWLYKSLAKLSKSIGQLSIYNGRPIDIIKRLVDANNISGVFWNKCYEPWRLDNEVAKYLVQLGIPCHTFNASLLWEPDSILKSDGTYYKVFTPFYKNGCLPKEPRVPENVNPNIRLTMNKVPDEGLQFKHNIWHDKLDINPGEAAAHDRLNAFLKGGANGYKEGRNFPATSHTSQLSPHLHFGEISPNQVWYKAKQADLPPKDLEHFLSELGWREFSYYLLHHFPGLPSQNFQAKFDKFPWSHDIQKLQAWQKGMTGYPIVDAAMRQLWQTGYMHNRTRMIAASFLVKNLFVHWHHGRDWFWDCLSDADLANNSAGWQWVAGSGADAAPYFRIFNPILQSEKFDPEGDYIRKYVPELSKLPNKFLHAPWTAPQDELASAKVRLGVDYPYPIIDFAETRNQSLEYYKTLS